MVRVLSFSSAFMMPTIVGYWRSFGMGMSEVMWLQAIFATTLALSETPSGYIADVLQRRTSVIISSVCFFSGGLLYLLADSFAMFVAVEVALAFGCAFMSGADSALLTESVRQLGGDRMEELRWRSKVITSGFRGGAVMLCLGGLLNWVDPRYPIWAEIVGYGLLVLAASSLREPLRVKKVRTASHLREFLSVGRYALIDNGQIRWVLLASGMCLTLDFTGLWLYQPLFEQSGLEPWFYGPLFAVFALVAAQGSKWAHRIGQRSDSFRVLVLPLALSTFTMLILGLSESNTAWLALFVLQLGRGTREVFSEQLLNAEVETGYRATVLSLQSMTARFPYAIALSIVGTWMGVHGMGATFLFLGIVGLVSIGALLWFEPQKRRRKEELSRMAV
ncbi:MAG: MFS transporter [Deltaproteobacteria bacterium]|nr:MFS transporter [Deltaproteobacteria bacterium]